MLEYATDLRSCWQHAFAVRQWPVFVCHVCGFTVLRRAQERKAFKASKTSIAPALALSDIAPLSVTLSIHNTHIILPEAYRP